MGIILRFQRQLVATLEARICAAFGVFVLRIELVQFRVNHEEYGQSKVDRRRSGRHGQTSRTGTVTTLKESMESRRVSLVALVLRFTSVRRISATCSSNCKASLSTLRRNWFSSW